MTPQKGYILKPISELPQESGEYICSNDKWEKRISYSKELGIWHYKYGTLNERISEAYTHWLQPFEGIVLTPEQLEEERRKAFEAAIESNGKTDHGFYPLPKYGTFEDYLNSIK